MYRVQMWTIWEVQWGMPHIRTDTQIMTQMQGSMRAWTKMPIIWVPKNINRELNTEVCMSLNQPICKMFVGLRSRIWSKYLKSKMIEIRDTKTSTV